MCRAGYAHFLTQYPYMVLLGVLMLAGTSLVVTLTLGHGFNFDDPLAGFEPRGTDIAERLIAFENLLENVGGRANLFPFSPPHVPLKDILLQTTSTPHHTHQPQSTSVSEQKRSTSNVTDIPENIFCGIPDKRYARLVVTSSEGRSLFNAKDLRAMCRLENVYLRGSKLYESNCISDVSSGTCCTAWSLGSYVALLGGKTSCLDITQSDVKRVLRLLTRCAPYFHNFTLLPNCHSDEEEWFYSIEHTPSYCPNVPRKCRTYNAVYHMLHFLTDSKFMHKHGKHNTALLHTMTKTKPFLKFAAIFLPLAANAYSPDIFLHLDSLPRNFKTIKIVGAHFGAKYSLFQRYIFLDSVWLGAAFGMIFIAMWLYTTSIFVTFTTFLSMFLAVELSYFLYTFVFKIHFFPYMNMVTLIVMLGIGADDLFIYCKVWHLAKSEKNNGVLEKITGDTLRHTALSMMVTSLTTAAAFYANFISDISAIRCFSVFAGTTMVINFLLTITWLPASVLVYEKWCHCCIGPSDQSLRIFSFLCKFPIKVYDSFSNLSRIFFEKVLPCLVIKFRYIWIFVFGGLWVASVIIVFYRPGLQLPNTQKFQVFASDHLLEKYDFELSGYFNFEHVKDGDDLPVFPVTVVWGIQPVDSGDPFDPYDKGSLSFDTGFDITTKDAQRWILQFCSSIRRSDFFLPSSGFLPTDCFLENFFQGYMTQPCMEDNLECCNQTQFPLQKSKMMSCLSQYIPSLKSTPLVTYNELSPGPRFDKGRISAFFVQFLSNHTFTYSFEETKSFYDKANQWVYKQLKDAPSEMQGGWFVSHLHFYDLQSSLALGTPLSLGVSLCVVAVVSFFTTLNVLVSFYALLTVAAAISVTLASLVLLDWKLDVLESVVITVAIGLAIDLTLHYGVAFRLAPDSGREMRVINSIGRMGSPVSMAALTTILAGAFMIPSTVLAYRKFGTFLLLLVSVAWLYATFFFMSLLRLVGPHGGFGQFHWPVTNCCSPSSREHVDKTSYALSESTLSTTSTTCSARDHGHHHHSYRDQELMRHYGHEKRGHNQWISPDIDGRRARRPPHHHQSHRHVYHRPQRKGEYTSVFTEESKADRSDNFEDLSESPAPQASVILDQGEKTGGQQKSPDSNQSDPSDDLSTSFLYISKQTEDYDNLLLKEPAFDKSQDLFTHPLSVT